MGHGSRHVHAGNAPAAPRRADERVFDKAQDKVLDKVLDKVNGTRGRSCSRDIVLVLVLAIVIVIVIVSALAIALAPRRPRVGPASAPRRPRVGPASAPRWCSSFSSSGVGRAALRTRTISPPEEIAPAGVVLADLVRGEGRRGNVAVLEHLVHAAADLADARRGRGTVARAVLCQYRRKWFAVGVGWRAGRRCGAAEPVTAGRRHGGSPR